MPLLDLVPSLRAGRLTTIAASLALILSASASPVSPSGALAPTFSPMPLPAQGATAYGNDISWPQCPKDGGGYGLPGPTADASFVVLGLTDGGSFRPNPCLAQQVASVKARPLWVSAYAIITYPTSAQLTRLGGSGTLTERLGRVGAAQADFNLATMARVGLRSPMVWVDVEPRTKSPWSAKAHLNNAVIDGVMKRYQAAGIRAGLYSYNKGWKAITGGRAMPGVPTWVPVGHQGLIGAAASCAMPGFAGGKPTLAQWTDDVRDFNLTCPGVTGWAARHRTPPVYSDMDALFARPTMRQGHGTAG